MRSKAGKAACLCEIPRPQAASPLPSDPGCRAAAHRTHAVSSRTNLFPHLSVELTVAPPFMTSSHQPRPVSAVASTTRELFSTSFYTDEDDDQFNDLDDILSGLPFSETSEVDEEESDTPTETEALQASFETEQTAASLSRTAPLDSLSPPTAVSTASSRRPPTLRRAAADPALSGTAALTDTAPAWPAIPKRQPSSSPTSSSLTQEEALLQPPPRPRGKSSAGLSMRTMRDYAPSPSSDNLDAYTAMSSFVLEKPVATVGINDGAYLIGQSSNSDRLNKQDMQQSQSQPNSCALSAGEADLPQIPSTRQRRSSRSESPQRPSPQHSASSPNTALTTHTSSSTQRGQPSSSTFPSQSSPDPTTARKSLFATQTSPPQLSSQPKARYSGMTGVLPRNRARTRDLPRLVLPELDLEPDLNDRASSRSSSSFEGGRLKWVSSQQRFVMSIGSDNSTAARDSSDDWATGSRGKRVPVDQAGNQILLDLDLNLPLPLPKSIKSATWRVHAAAALPHVYDPTWHASFFEFCFDLWPALDKMHAAAADSLPASLNVRSSSGSTSGNPLSAAYAFIALCYSSHDWALGESLVLSFLGGMCDHDELFQYSAGQLPEKMLCQAVVPLMRIYHPQQVAEFSELVAAGYPRSRINGRLSARWCKSVDRLARLKEVHPESDVLLLAYLLDQN